MSAHRKSLASSSATRWQKSVVVAVERQVRHGVYGKTQRRTSQLHGARRGGRARRSGDTVAIVESRPLSRRKRWVVTRVVEKAQQI